MRLQQDTLAYQIIGCVMDVYKALDPGLLESVYQKALLKELEYNEIHAEAEVPIDVFYRGENLGVGFRMDILVKDTIILELKSVSQLEKVHFKQLQTYLKLADKPLGYLINFNSDDFCIGKAIHKIINTNFIF